MIQFVRQIMRHILVAILITNTVTANAQQRRRYNTDPRSRECKNLMNEIRQRYEAKLQLIPSDAQLRLREGLAAIERTQPGRDHVRELKTSSRNNNLNLVHSRGDEFEQLNTQAVAAAATSANYVQQRFAESCANTSLVCSADESSIRVCSRPNPDGWRACLQSDWSAQAPSHSSVPIAYRVLYRGDRAYRTVQDYLDHADDTDTVLTVRHRTECSPQNLRQPVQDGQSPGTRPSNDGARASGAH